MLLRVSCQAEQSRLNQVMNWLGQVASWRGPDDVLAWMSPVNIGLGGSGGGLGRGGQVQATGLSGAHCPKCNVWDMISGGFIMRCLAVINVSTKANPLVRLELPEEIP